MNSVQEFISAWGGLMDAAVVPHPSGSGWGISQGVRDPGVRSTGEFPSHEWGGERNVPRGHRPRSAKHWGISLDYRGAMRFPRSGISIARPHGECPEGSQTPECEALGNSPSDLPQRGNRRKRFYKEKGGTHGVALAKCSRKFPNTRRMPPYGTNF